MNNRTTLPINFCFQQSGNVHKLYIYDDVSEYGEFDWTTWTYKESETSAKYFRKSLGDIPDGSTIELHVNSNGGSVKEGVTIYNLLKQKNAHITGIVDGVAYSVAFLILQACDERVMCLGTSAMIHEMWVSACGNARELRKLADDLDVLMQSNRQVFLERSNLEEQELAEMMTAETFLTPDQCIEYGLIDRIEGKTEVKDTSLALQQRVTQLSEALEQRKTLQELAVLMNPQLAELVKTTEIAPAQHTLESFLKICE